ncbi:MULTISPECIES: ABC transporter ATP-binding protein [Fictibacillus]|uniref:Spermidine/putrescine ABC transporter ATP-binding protein n=1 Tax=Fictibacillus enclensis TaxID=1017270 RepID=A0A0V8J993_9BACL|nr:MULTISPECIES: ABC transporter ATP-binding protein [Fictibacillus]KSU83581.1 spermidine/putrescine ABC transporter ATP-binding protein [Fictibacillus enclensis]RXZ02398.1 ABC transporter ATP-binding protein [Fictibacillus sp. S7]WHY70918.1 ABC transporter ATP-binding protein [Fictibacillus enclensis]SCC17812.1 NitT/TauT family transport system ATP-binding protein [Fictibacillus enclensis]
MAFLQLKSIGQTYFSKQTATTALEDITLSVSEGEFVSFLGPSGCGKSTLLSIISGLIQPTNGTVSLKNQLITQPHAKIGYMLQQDYLFPWKTIKDNILVGLKLQGCLNDERTSYALSLMSEIGLYDTLDKYPNELSGGMRQRVALVRTLATNPQILLLDEPFSALDYQTKLKLEDLVSTTLREHGKTAILVTHDIGEAIAMSDRIILFSTKPGRIFRTFPVSGHLRKRLPFEARQHPDYSVMFQQIWEELEQIEQNDTE